MSGDGPYKTARRRSQVRARTHGARRGADGGWSRLALAAIRGKDYQPFDILRMREIPVLQLIHAALSLLAFLILPGGAAAQEPRRVALVIGNDAYQSLSKLNNPRLDAARLAGLLASNGFDVVSCDGARAGCFDL